MNILVTGANGFLGLEIINQLLANHYHVIAMVRNINTVQTSNPLIEYVVADVCDKQKVNQIFEERKIDKVVHLAYSMDIFGKDPENAINTNIQGFINIVEACKNHSIKKLVWCSSVMVYGKAKDYVHVPVNENHPTNPVSLYGRCKEFCEFLTNHYSENFNQDIICLRPTTIYGPGRYVRGAAGFLYDCTYAAKTGQEVTVNQLAVTDFVHVNDVGKAFVLALESKKTAHRVFNISGEEVNAESLIPIYEELINKELKIKFEQVDDNLFPTKIDSSKAETILGYKPTISIKDGLRDYLAKFNPDVPLKR